MRESGRKLSNGIDSLLLMKLVADALQFRLSLDSRSDVERNRADEQGTLGVDGKLADQEVVGLAARGNGLGEQHGRTCRNHHPVATHYRFRHLGAEQILRQLPNAFGRSRQELLLEIEIGVAKATVAIGDPGEAGKVLRERGEAVLLIAQFA